jgi:hypothetical protein
MKGVVLAKSSKVEDLREALVFWDENRLPPVDDEAVSEFDVKSVVQRYETIFQSG